MPITREIRAIVRVATAAAGAADLRAAVTIAGLGATGLRVLVAGATTSAVRGAMAHQKVVGGMIVVAAIGVVVGVPLVSSRIAIGRLRRLW